MTKKINLDHLRNENIGKTFSWLTVLDVFRDSKNKIKFKCQCKCGKECIKDFGKVLTGHTKSCGCFKFTKDYSDKLKSIWSTKQDVIRDRADKWSQWHKDNPDKVRLKVERRINTYLENPDILKQQIASRKRTLEENPEIQQRINEKNRLAWDDDKRAKFSEDIKQRYIDNPDLGSRITSSLKKFYQDNPDKREEISVRAKQWAEDNRDKIEEHGKRHSENLKKRRLSFIKKAQQDSSSDFEEFTKAIHPFHLNDLLSGDISAKDIIEIKCPTCGKYEKHTFNSVWQLAKMKFRTGRPPFCECCRLQLSSSSFEDEISSIIKSFYDGLCIRNSREIISPFELDLYYPDKNIAIEYNGSYWHNESCKPIDYHYNKFITCYNSGIILVSIFDRDWVYNKEKVIAYLKYLFNDEENCLSYTDQQHEAIDLNYPTPNLDLLEFSEIHENYYLDRGKKVFTCGYAVKKQIAE
jgi:hypothetical protein